MLLLYFYSAQTAEGGAPNGETVSCIEKGDMVHNDICVCYE